MHFFFSIFLSLSPAHSLFLFPLSPFSPARPSLAGLYFFFFSLHHAAQPSSLLRSSLSPAQRPTRHPALSSPSSLSLPGGTRLSGSSPTLRQAWTRARVQPRHEPHLRPCDASAPHAKAPRPSYKAAAPRPRPCKTHSRPPHPVNPSRASLLPPHLSRPLLRSFPASHKGPRSPALR
jgi:hypothetical protein